MWKLVKGEFKYARNYFIATISLMAFFGYLWRLIYPCQPKQAEFLSIMPVIFGLCVLILSWFKSLKMENRDVLIACLPVSNTGFALFRIITPLMWYLFIMAYYLSFNQFITGNNSIASLIYSSLLWPIFNTAYSITTDIFNGLNVKSKSRSKGNFLWLLSMAMVIAIIFGSFALAGWLFPDLVYENISYFFMYLILFIILSAVSVLTYTKRTRFV